jgi:hypothetical protein
MIAHCFSSDLECFHSDSDDVQGHFEWPGSNLGCWRGGFGCFRNDLSCLRSGFESGIQERRVYPKKLTGQAVN